MKTINQKVIITNATPAQIYNGLLDSSMHSKFTGGKAKITNKTGDTFTAWDEYITGKNVELIPDKKIVQEWKCTEFSDTAQVSTLTLKFKKVPGGTEIIMEHANVPVDLYNDLNKGWIDHYWKPMQKYFDKN